MTAPLQPLAVFAPAPYLDKFAAVEGRVEEAIPTLIIVQAGFDKLRINAGIGYHRRSEHFFFGLTGLDNLGGHI